jgi:hypothetical protein
VSVWDQVDHNRIAITADGIGMNLRDHEHGRGRARLRLVVTGLLGRGEWRLASI